MKESAPSVRQSDEASDEVDRQDQVQQAQNDEEHPSQDSQAGSLPPGREMFAESVPLGEGYTLYLPHRASQPIRRTPPRLPPHIAKRAAQLLIDRVKNTA